MKTLYWTEGEKLSYWPHPKCHFVATGIPITPVDPSNSLNQTYTYQDQTTVKLLQDISRYTHCSYGLVLREPYIRGEPDANGTWNGLMGETLSGRPDIITHPMGIFEKGLKGKRAKTC